MDYNDIQITCKDCGNEFTWSARDQQFFAEKGFSAPIRCKDCRMKKRGDQGGRQSGPRQMYDIVCKECQKPGQVPFEPRTDDVLCRDCFNGNRDGGSSHSE